MQNVRRARIRGLESSAEGTLWGVQLKASFASQRPRDEDTAFACRAGPAFRAPRGLALVRGVVVVRRRQGSGERFDSPTESPGTRLPGYAIADATVRYAAARAGPWSSSPRTCRTSVTSHTSATTPPAAAALNVRFERLSRLAFPATMAVC